MPATARLSPLPSLPMRWTSSSPSFHTALALGLLTLLAILAELGGQAFAAGLLLAVLPVPLYLLLALWLDRYEPEPWRMLATTFLWGASVAVFVALVFNTIAGAIFEAALGGPAEVVTAVLSAPMVEELAKGLALVLIFRRERDEFDNVTDGVVYAAMVGLGFAMTENVQYYGRAFMEGEDAPSAIFLLRGVASPFAHPLFTAMTGIGLGLARETASPWRRRVAPALGLLAAIVLHLLWNLSASFGDAFALTYLLVMVPVFAGTLLVVRASLRREARVIREQLSNLLECGTLTRDELDLLCSTRGRMGAALRAALREGPAGWRRHRRFHHTATELAFHRWRMVREGGDVVVEEELLVRLRAIGPRG